MSPERVLRFEIPGRDRLERIASAPLPLDLRETASRFDAFRVLFFDTVAGDLERKGLAVRLHIRPDGRRQLVVDVRERETAGATIVRRHAGADVPALEPKELFAGDSEPAQLVRALIDPAQLVAALELETVRRVRVATADQDLASSIEFAFDDVTIRSGDLAAEFQELEICVPEDAATSLPGLVQEIEHAYGARFTLAGRAARARVLLDRLRVERLEHEVRAARQVAVVAYDQGRVALLRTESQLRVPAGHGSGEDACRRVLRACFDGGGGRVRVLGTSAGGGLDPAVEVWLAEEVDREMAAADLVWLRIEDALDMVGSPRLRDVPTLAALAAVARAGVASWAEAWSRDEVRAGPLDETGAQHLFDLAERGLDDFATDELPPELLLNTELARLAFDERMLVVIEDDRTPVLEAVRFLSMYASRADDFFITRVAEFKHQQRAGAGERTDDGLTAGEQLELMRLRARRMAGRAYRALGSVVLPRLREHGVELLRWDELDAADREYLLESYSSQLESVITPVVTDPSHPFPHLRNLRPAIAAVVRLPDSTRTYFVAIELPSELPRFVPLPADGNRRAGRGGHVPRRGFVPLEEVILAILPHLYPGLRIVRAHTFRVTRSGNVQFDAESPSGVLVAVEEEISQRPFGEAVRLEVEAGMPRELCDRILRELQFETPDTATALSEADVYQVEWLVDLAALREIAALDIPELQHPPRQQRVPLDLDRSMFELLRERERLVRFPDDAFDATVERLLTEAAEDPDVLAIKTTLYRVNPESRIVQALANARRAGKNAFALVELKATFDERRNIEWARSLKEAGIHVVHSPAKFKVHAKIALVTRREAGGVRHYFFVGTGNLNATTAAAYTDVVLFSADPELGEELNAVFNVLTGYSAATDFEHLIVSPFNTRRRFLELIEREVEHAKAGRGGHIRIQLNGLADRRMIAALYRASEAGVRIELAVREICTLRPGLQGVSSNIRVVSKLGRFLEHARIFHFGNAGQPEYFVGSADWRPRNLSKRVEVIAPVRDPEHRAVLNDMLESILRDPEAWELRPDGTYVRGTQVIPDAGDRPMVSTA